VPTYNYGFYIQELPRTLAQKQHTPPKTKKAVRKVVTSHKAKASGCGFWSCIARPAVTW
jgi:hypothetical protein